MQEIEMPNGNLIREFFTDHEVKKGLHEKRRKRFESKGGKFIRLLKIEVKARSKYVPHVGRKQIERELRRLAKEKA